MLLDQQDLQLFFKLYNPLLLFVNQHLNIYSSIKGIDDFLKLKSDKKKKIRDRLYENIDILEKFYEENPANFTEKELGILLKWKHFLKDKFFVYKQYKKYCVLLHQNKPTKAYAVLGLSQPIENFIPNFPCLIETVLLPFKDKIIYDGMLVTYSILFGSNIKSELKEEYEEAKAKFGLIEQLPFIKPADEEITIGLLKYYLKNEDNIDYYELEVEELLEENPDLLNVYHQELGRTYSKKYLKRLKALGILNSWFALYDDIIIASGLSEKEARENMKRILPNIADDFVFLFQVK